MISPCFLLRERKKTPEDSFSSFFFFFQQAGIRSSMPLPGSQGCAFAGVLSGRGFFGRFFFFYYVSWCHGTRLERGWREGRDRGNYLGI